MVCLSHWETFGVNQRKGTNMCVSVRCAITGTSALPMSCTHTSRPKLKESQYTSGKQPFVLYVYFKEKSRKTSRMFKIFSFDISTPLFGNTKMLHFDANPIRIGYLVTEL